MVHAPSRPGEIAALWRWRDGASIAVTAQRGGKVSEDIVVPVERLQEAIEATIEIGRRHDVPACSWGHAGDGNLHSTFMIDREDPAELERSEEAAHELFELAVRLGGSVSGEHGLGSVKNGTLALQWGPAAVAMHEAIKRVFDPKNLLNPGKKLARSVRFGVRRHRERSLGDAAQGRRTRGVAALREGPRTQRSAARGRSNAVAPSESGH